MLLGAQPSRADGTATVVGIAATNANSYDINVNMQVCSSCGDNSSAVTWSWNLAANRLCGITFEGKKLYIADWTDYYNGTDWFYIKEFDKSTQKNYNTVHSSWEAANTYNTKIWNYNESSDGGEWYSALAIKESARFYFDASNWSETAIKLCVGHANYQGYYSLSNIEHTKLYYGTPGAAWTDAMGVGVVGKTIASDGTNWLTNVSARASEYTGFKHQALNQDADGYAYLMVNNGKAGQEPTISSNENFLTLLNNTQTIKYSVNNGGSFAELTEGTVPANITMSSYKFAEGTYDGVSASNASVALTQSGSNYSATIGAARTANTTLTVSNIAAGYFFIGWYSEANGGICLEKGDTYTYNPVEDGTVYARFEYGDYPLNISSALWSSLYLPQAVVVPANCKAYYVSDVTGTTATLVAINAGQVIPAATPVIVEATASGTYYFNYSASNADAPTPNLLHGVTATTPIESIAPGAGNTLYVLGVKESVVGFYVPSAQITTLAPYKAYLIAGTITGAPMIRFEENDATGIQNVKVSEKTVKFIENGKLFIQKDGVVYDMIGRVVR